MEHVGRTEAQDTKNTVYWLAQDHLLRRGTTHNGLSPPISITKKMPTGLLTDHLMNAFSKLWFPLLIYISRLYQADKKVASTRPKFNLQHYKVGEGRRKKERGERERKSRLSFFSAGKWGGD